MRVTFGNGLVKMRVGGKTYPVPDTDDAVGYELRPGAQARAARRTTCPTCA